MVDCTCEHYVLVVLLELNWAVLVQLRGDYALLDPLTSLPWQPGHELDDLHALKGHAEGWRAVGKLDEDMCENDLNQDEKVIKCRRKSKDERAQPNPQRKYGTPLK